MAVNMFDTPARGEFINTYARLPFREIAMMGEQLEKTRGEAEKQAAAASAALQMDAIDYGDLQDKDERKRILSGYETEIAGLGDLYYKNPAEAKRMAQDIARRMQIDKTRGEWAAIQGRYDTLAKQKEALRKKFIDPSGKIQDPQLYNYRVNQLMKGIEQLDWDPSTGSYGAVGSAPGIKYTTAEDTRKHIFDTAKNIKADQFLTSNAPKHLMKMNFTDILQNPSYHKYVKWNEAAGVLANSLTDSDRQSAELRGLAYGKGAGQSQIFDYETDAKGNPIKDAQGNYKLKYDKNKNIQFANTELGRMLQSGSQYGSFDQYGTPTYTKIKDDMGLQIGLDRLEANSNIIVSAGEAMGLEGIDYKTFAKNREDAEVNLKALNKDIAKALPGFYNMSDKARIEAIKKKSKTDPRFKELAQKYEAQQIVVENMKNAYANTWKQLLPELQADYGYGFENLAGDKNARFRQKLWEQGTNVQRALFAGSTNKTKGPKVKLDGPEMDVIEEAFRLGLKNNTSPKVALSIAKKRLKKKGYSLDKILSPDFDTYFVNEYKLNQDVLHNRMQERLEVNPGEISRQFSPIAATSSGKYSASIGAKEQLYSKNFGQYNWNDARDGSLMGFDEITEKYEDEGKKIDWTKTSVLFTDGLGVNGLPVDQVILYDKNGAKVGVEQLVRKDGWSTYEATRDVLLSSNNPTDRAKGEKMRNYSAMVQGQRIGPIVQAAGLHNMYDSRTGAPRTNRQALTGIRDADNNPFYVKALPPRTGGQRTWQLETKDGTILTDRSGNPVNYIGTEEQLAEVLYNITRP
jgi:hypothetical protein